METISKILVVAAGGAAGSVARYLINISPLARLFDRFPFPTFVINVVGCFVIGVVIALFAERFAESEYLKLAVIVGFLGAFTTFSTFELELFDLSRERQFATAIVYLLISVVVGYASVAAGFELGRRF